MTPAPPSANSLSSAVVNRMSSLTTATRSGSPDTAISNSSEILTPSTFFISKCTGSNVLIAAGAREAPAHGDHRVQPSLGGGPRVGVGRQPVQCVTLSGDLLVEERGGQVAGQQVLVDPIRFGPLLDQFVHGLSRSGEW